MIKTKSSNYITSFVSKAAVAPVALIMKAIELRRCRFNTFNCQKCKVYIT